MSFPSGFKEGPTLRGGTWSAGFRGQGAGLPGAHRHPGARPALLQRGWCCCCNHVFPSQTSDNCLQGCIFRGNLAGCESSLPAGQLVALPLMPTLHALPRAALENRNKTPPGGWGRNHAVMGEQGDLPRVAAGLGNLGSCGSFTALPALDRGW